MTREALLHDIQSLMQTPAEGADLARLERERASVAVGERLLETSGVVVSLRLVEQLGDLVEQWLQLAHERRVFARTSACVMGRAAHFRAGQANIAEASGTIRT